MKRGRDEDANPRSVKGRDERANDPLQDQIERIQMAQRHSTFLYAWDVFRESIGTMSRSEKIDSVRTFAREVAPLEDFLEIAMESGKTRLEDVQIFYEAGARRGPEHPGPRGHSVAQQMASDFPLAKRWIEWAIHVTPSGVNLAKRLTSHVALLILDFLSDDTCIFQLWIADK